MGTLIAFSNCFIFIPNCISLKKAFAAFRYVMKVTKKPFWSLLCFNSITITIKLIATQRWSKQPTFLVHPNQFQTSLFIPSEEVSVYLKSSFKTSSYSIWGKPTFCFPQNDWMERMIFGNLSPFTRWVYRVECTLWLK